MSAELPPPKYVHAFELDPSTKVLTLPMVRAYAAAAVAAERERLAQLFDIPATLHGEAESWAREVAARIRA